MSTTILIDTSYFIFYRYYALMAWWKLAKPDDILGNPIENSEFVEKFKKTFIDKLREIPKKLKIKDYIFIAGLDCPRCNIWRNDVSNTYKENRIYDDKFLGGPFFKFGIDILNEMNIKTLSHNRLEADDCIALYTFELCKSDCMIYIITNDMDYLQLAAPNVKLLNLKYKYLTDNKKWYGNPEKDLFIKIIMGDKSDDIPAIFNKCGPKMAEKCFNDKEYFKSRLKIENAYDKYEKNTKLIDFKEIPEKIITDFYNKFIIS